MPQHYNVGLGGGVHGLSLPSAASLQQPPPSPLPPHTVGASTGDVERQKLRETLAKRMNQKKIAAAAQQHRQQLQQQSVSGTPPTTSYQQHSLPPLPQQTSPHAAQPERNVRNPTLTYSH
uniref:Microphthalmia-associated transcription factor n=1 Tax=Mesocestoides corti TaxID=53468 RepID=A0A5K3G6Y6_MESCO